jgi:hypothetical protein
LTLCLIAVVPAVAQGPWPTSAGTSGVTAVNMGDTSGEIVPTYVAEDGTKYALPSETLDAGKAKTWYAEPASEDSFRGAVVLSSNVRIAAIGRTEWPVGGGDGAASYSGQPAGATEVVLPQLVIEHYGTTSAFTVQNTDMDNAITVDLAFTPKGGATFNKTMNIAAGASTTMDLAFDTDFVDPAPASNAGWIGAVRITSSTPVVAAAHTTSQAAGFVYAYDGFTDLTQTQAFAPLVRRNFANLTTGIGVADASGNGGTVTVEYKGFADANGNYQEDPGEAYTATDTGTLPANGSLTFYQGDPAYSDATIDIPQRFLGSAEISVSGAGAAIAVVVNDQSDPGYGGKQTASAYSGFFADQASDKVVSPLARNGFYNFTTGISVQNVGADEVHVEIVYATSADSINTSTPPAGHANLTSGQSATFYLPTDWGSSSTELSWLGSAELTATGSGETSIVAITNDQDVSPPISGDTALFNCFSK